MTRTVTALVQDDEQRWICRRPNWHLIDDARPNASPGDRATWVDGTLYVGRSSQRYQQHRTETPTRGPFLTQSGDTRRDAELVPLNAARTRSDNSPRTSTSIG